MLGLYLPIFRLASGMVPCSPLQTPVQPPVAASMSWDYSLENESTDLELNGLR